MDTDRSITGKTVIVTGAGRGIGRAIARRLAAAGAKVVVAARTHQELAETQRLIENGGGVVLPIVADVSDAGDVARIIDETLSQFERIDVLVNNAGFAPLVTIDQMEPQVFDAVLAVNVRSVYLCSRAVWPVFTEQHSGVIINISSVAADDPFPGFAAYGGAKAFVNTYTRALAAEGRAAGIRVYAVAPGAVDTPMLRGPFPDFPEDKLLAPDDVASLVELLLSPGGRHISGQTLTIKRD